MKRGRFRIFLSSPGDVTPAREIAAQVIEKLAHEYVRFFSIEPYMWEYEPMLASGHFQDSIDPPSQFDAVILILESRLGTPLPERTAVREYRGIDGRVPVTGTEWEYENALDAARKHGVPDLLVYRSRRKAEIDTWDAHRREAVLKQIEALDGFWSRNFADGGQFMAGFAHFLTLEEFSAKLEKNLRTCIERRIAEANPRDRSQSIRLWPTAPFRGLESYEFEHAPIFFGREEAVGTALLRLVTSAEAQRPFLLVLGASGSGKSSLVKAGVVPRLLVPQRISGVAFLRRSIFRPGDVAAQEDLFDALARNLTTGDGEMIGLPELLGSSMTTQRLADHLRHTSAHPDLPFAMVLDRLAQSARDRGRMLRFEQPKYLLVIDQLEELFTAERLEQPERLRFVQLLESLVRSGLIWVVATMRSDFWHRASETPPLLTLADGHGRLDLPPPSQSELSHMIRCPAEAAAIAFETNPTTGIALNDLIAQEAATEPGALPLLSYLLGQLYQNDVQDAGGQALTYASFERLGGLKGAIATRADAVVASQPAEVQAALRPLLFALVQMTESDGSVEHAVARRAPLADFPEGTAKRRLIEALLDPAARLVIADATGNQAATVRVAHEALISEWRTARDFIRGNAEALKTRHTVESRFARWLNLSQNKDSDQAPLASAGGAFSFVRMPFAREQGLLTDIDLVDARRLLQLNRDELSSGLIQYIERSIVQARRRRGRTMRLVTMVAVVMTVLAIAAANEARIAALQRDAIHSAQLRSLTQAAAASLKDGDVSKASAIILEVLSSRGSAPPYSADALSVFQEARAADAAILALTGHDKIVRCAAFSSDGRRIITASWDETARIWDSASGQVLLTLRGHKGRVVQAEFSSDDMRILTASVDQTARIWDAHTGQLLLTLSGHTARVSGAAFSPDARRVVTASADKTARIWDANSGRLLQTFTMHSDRVISAAFSPDGTRVITASADKTARIWDAATARQLFALSGHGDRVVTATFSNDGSRALTASWDNTARVWDAFDGRQLGVLSGHADHVEGAAFSPDGRQITTASDDKTARVWDAESFRQLQVLSGHTDYVESAAFSPDGRYIATASDDGTARVWEAASRLELVVLKGHTDFLKGADFSPHGERVVTAADDKTARIWDAASGAQLRVLKGHEERVESAVFSHDGRRIATASADQTARIWDAETGESLETLRGHSDSLESAAFSHDGQKIVTASMDKTARIWDATSGQTLRVLSGHKDVVDTARFSPNDHLVLTTSFDKTARLWDTSTGKQVMVLEGHTDVVASGAFSPDARRIVTASSDNTARIWDTASGRQITVLSGHADRVEDAVFSPDGRRVATASLDKTARIWNADTGEQLLVLRGHSDLLSGVDFSSDNSHIVTSSFDGTARIWDARAPALGVQFRWALAAQFEALTSGERFQLGLPPSSDMRAWNSPSACDTAAGAWYDPDRRAPGVSLDEIVVDVATRACQSIASSSSDARSMYERGRTSMAAGDLAAARNDLLRALESGYRSAGIDLAKLLLSTSSGSQNVPLAVASYEKAWANGVHIAAFELGSLYEQGGPKAPKGSGSVFDAEKSLAWSWYKKGADAGEPNALARFAEREERAALEADGDKQRDDRLLSAFEYYASAAECARLESWPDTTLRGWRFRRASLARVLARNGLVEQVAARFEAVQSRYAQHSALSVRSLTAR